MNSILILIYIKLFFGIPSRVSCASVATESGQQVIASMESLLQGSWACTVAGLAAHSGLTSVLK